MFFHHHYDAFTGISYSKKNAIVQFLLKYLDNTWMEEAVVKKAVEYATKEIPSFGGFVLTAEKNEEIVAALIVNKTGLSGLMPEYLVVLKATKPTAKDKLITRKLEEKAIVLSRSDISNVVAGFGPRELLLEDMAPKAKLMPLRKKEKNQKKSASA